MYRLYKEKINLLRDTATPDQIGYDVATKYVFNASMSGAGLAESDTFISVSIGCAAGFQLFWQTLGQPYYESALGSGHWRRAVLTHP